MFFLHILSIILVNFWMFSNKILIHSRCCIVDSPWLDDWEPSSTSHTFKLCPDRCVILVGKYLRLLCNNCLFLNSTALLATSVWLQTLVHIFSLFYNPELESNSHSDCSLWFQGAPVQICHFENTAALSFEQLLMHRDVAHVSVFSSLYAFLFAWDWHSSPQVVWSLCTFQVL